MVHQVRIVGDLICLVGGSTRPSTSKVRLHLTPINNLVDWCVTPYPKGFLYQSGLVHLLLNHIILSLVYQICIIDLEVVPI